MTGRTPASQRLLRVGLCYYLMCFVPLQGTCGSSLMKRIREKQNADHAMNRGLELESGEWLRVPQPVQDVLSSIDDKLRSLDTLSYTLKLARLDFSLDQLVRRMENIETKLGRLETKFDVRMEKVEEIVISKDIKEEFSNEHLSRRMENLNERINNKAAYLDAKLDMKLDRIASKLELLERDLHSSADDVLEKLIKSDERHVGFESEMLEKGEDLTQLSRNFEELRIFLKEDVPNSLETQFSGLKLQVEGLETKLLNGTNGMVTSLNEAFTSLNNTVRTSIDSQIKSGNFSVTCDHVDRTRSLTNSGDVSSGLLRNLTSTLEKAVLVSDSKFEKLDSNVELYSRKLVNNIQELWKTTDQLKVDTSSLLEQANKTQEFMRLQFRRLYDEMDPLPRLEIKLSDATEGFDRKILELGAAVDRRFATLLLAQSSFIDSCRRIQEEETQVYHILQHIVYEMRNRSEDDMRRINADLQLHWTRISTSLSQMTSAMWAAGNTSVQITQKLQLRTKDKCVLKTDDIKWKVVDSICRQVSIDMPSSNEKLVDIVRSAISFDSIDENVIHALPNHSTHSDSDHSSLSNHQSPRSARNDDSGNSSFTDYEMDYPLPDADYSDHLND